MADLLSRPRFADDDVTREKSVVREEIFSCEDNPEDKVNEMQAEQLWPGHSLGRPILGTVETVDGLDRAAVREYHASRHRPDGLVIAGAGAVDHPHLCAEVERGRADLRRASAVLVRPLQFRVRGEEERERRPDRCGAERRDCDDASDDAMQQ